MPTRLLTSLFRLTGFVLCVATAGFSDTKKPDCGGFSNPKFNCVAEYETANAYVGNNFLELGVSLVGNELTGIEVTCASNDEPNIVCTSQGSTSPLLDNGLNRRIWKFRINIKAGVEPKSQPVTLSFTYGGKTLRKQDIPLLVGVKSNGKVVPGPELKNAPEVLSGIVKRDNFVSVKLINGFANYPVNVQSIHLRSDPEWIIEAGPQNTVGVNRIIEAGGTTTIDVPFKASPLSFTALFSGFGAEQIHVDVVYDDTYGRTVQDLTIPIRVRVRPTGGVLAVAMLIGVAAGALIKFYLQRLQETGRITGKQALTFVATMFIGLVVAVIAMVAKIQIVAFTISGSYDQPLVLFTIALAGALGGAQILSTWFLKEKAAAKT